MAFDHIPSNEGQTSDEININSMMTFSDQKKYLQLNFWDHKLSKTEFQVALKQIHLKRQLPDLLALFS